jgi:hypothetical protein
MSDPNTPPTFALDNGFIHLEALANSGPRVTHLSVPGGQNLLARLPMDVKLTSQYGDFHFLGGHRLWHSPEAIPRTYIPDNDGLAVEKFPDGARLTGSTEPGTGITKTIEVRLSPNRAAVTLTHTLRNDGLWPVEFAPWAISMMRVGGVAIFPQPLDKADPDGLLNNRILSIWPYTRINDPRLILRDDYILIKANPVLPPLKIGYYNPYGWMAYWVDGVLFRKSFDLHPGELHPDGGCNAETYSCDMFIELETLGPLTKLAPASSVTLTETWELFNSLNQPFIPEEIQALIAAC